MPALPRFNIGGLRRISCARARGTLDPAHAPAVSGVKESNRFSDRGRPAAAPGRASGPAAANQSQKRHGDRQCHAMSVGQAVPGNQRRPRRWRVGLASAEFPEIDTALVRREEIQERLVVIIGHAEERHDGPVVPARRRQAALDQLAQIVAAHVAIQKQRVGVLPERVDAGDQS